MAPTWWFGVAASELRQEQCGRNRGFTWGFIFSSFPNSIMQEADSELVPGSNNTKLESTFPKHLLWSSKRLPGNSLGEEISSGQVFHIYTHSTAKLFIWLTKTSFNIYSPTWRVLFQQIQEPFRWHKQDSCLKIFLNQPWTPKVLGEEKGNV